MTEKSGTPAKAGAIEKATKPAETEPGRKRWMSWVLGWVVLPGMVIGGIVGGGVLVGANFHDTWFTHAFVWVFAGLFS